MNQGRVEPWISKILENIPLFVSMVFQIIYVFFHSHLYIYIYIYIFIYYKFLYFFIYIYILSELNCLLIRINTMCCPPPVHCVCFLALQSNPKCKQVPFSWEVYDQRKIKAESEFRVCNFLADQTQICSPVLKRRLEEVN